MIQSDYYDRLSKVESGDNPSARNPVSSAKGRYQFIDSTAQQYGITAEFGTPEYEQQERVAVEKFTADNFNTLKSALKREPTPGELYLAHQQGAVGASKVLSSPNALAVEVLGKDAVLKNGGNEKMTAAEFASKWTQKFESDLSGGEGQKTMIGEPGADKLQGSFTKEQILQELERRKTKGVNAEVPVAGQFTREQILAEIQKRKKEKGTPNYIQRVYKMAQDREQNIRNTNELARQYGSDAAGFIPKIGEAAALIGDVGFETVATVSRTVAPELTAEIANLAGKTVTAVMNTPPARLLSGEYKDFKTKHPLLAENIEGGLMVASFIIPAAAPKATLATAGKGIDATVDAGKNIVDATLAAGRKVAETSYKTSDDVIKNASMLTPAAKAVRPAMQINQTEQAIKRILKTSDKSYGDLLDELRNTDILTIADIAGDEVQGLTRSLGKMEGAKNIIHSTLRQRGETAITRVSAVLSEKISNVDNYFGNIDELGKARAAAARPLYKKAFEEGANIADDRLVKFLNDKRIIDAIDDAKLRYGVRAEAAANSLESLDGVKKVLYDIESAAKRSGETNLAGAYGDLRRSLVEVLDDASPSYKQARKVFEDPSRLIDAQELGRGFTKLQPEEIKKILSDFQPHEIEAYRIGVRQKLQEIVSTTADDANPARRLFGNDMKRKQLQSVFETQEHYDEFAKRMQEEITGFETRNAILSGSRTDYNLAADDAFGAGIDAVVDASRRGVIPLAIDKSILFVTDRIKSAYTGISKKNAQEIAEILVDREKGIKALQDLLEKQTDFQQRAAVGQVIKNHGAATMLTDMPVEPK